MLDLSDAIAAPLVRPLGARFRGGGSGRGQAGFRLGRRDYGPGRNLAANRLIGLIALAALPVLLAISLASGTVVAVPAAILVPLLAAGRTGYEEVDAAMATPVPLLTAFGIGVALVVAGGFDSTQPVGINLLLLLGFGSVALICRIAVPDREGAEALRNDRTRRAAVALTAVDACMQDCVAIGIDSDLRCVAATPAADSVIGPDNANLAGGDIGQMASLYDRPRLLAAALDALQGGKATEIAFRLAGDDRDGHGITAWIKPVADDIAILILNPVRLAATGGVWSHGAQIPEHDSDCTGSANQFDRNGGKCLLDPSGARPTSLFETQQAAA